MDIPVALPQWIRCPAHRHRRRRRRRRHRQYRPPSVHRGGPVSWHPARVPQPRYHTGLAPSASPSPTLPSPPAQPTIASSPPFSFPPPPVSSLRLHLTSFVPLIGPRRRMRFGRIIR